MDGISVLKGVPILVLKGFGVLFHIRDVRIPILGEIELRLLRQNLRLILQGTCETVGHTFVIGAERQRELFEYDGDLIVIVADHSLLVGNGRKSLVHTCLPHFTDLVILSEHDAAGQGHGNL